jgi:selenium metabolism protein YedF
MRTRDGFVLLVASDELGRGDEDLGRLLIDRFLHEIAGASHLPETAVFINSGVKLVADDSPVLDALEHLVEMGVHVVACGTCLARYEISERVAVGDKSDMRSIVGILTGAARVLSV